MRVIKSVMYGYLGAMLGGLLVALIGVALGFSKASIAAAAMPTGVVFGLLGLSLIWWRPVAQRVGLEAGRPGSDGRDRPRP